MAPALRHLYVAANPTLREYDGFMDVISGRAAAIGRYIREEVVDTRIIFPKGSYAPGDRRGWMEPTPCCFDNTTQQEITMRMLFTSTKKMFLVLSSIFCNVSAYR